MSVPKPCEVHVSGALLHGTKADLAVGDLLLPGRPMNYDEKRIANHVYVTRTLDAAVWGAELASGDAPGRVYLVEALGPLEDDPNVTDTKYPGIRPAPTAPANRYGSSGKSSTGWGTRPSN